MKEKYNQEGFLNIIKFNKENILKQEYKTEEMNSKPNQIHINIGFTDVNINTYIKHISSILKNADKEKTCLHIHMIDAGEFNYDTFKKLVKMVDSINTFTEIIVYNANQALKDFNIRSDAVDKFSPEYAKLYAFKVLKDIQKIIFLDADDLMVEKDLEELYELKMDDIYARGIAEDPSIKYEMDWYDKYILDKSHYINCGVLLVNLELCQRDSLYQKAIDLNNAEFYMKTENPAQDILNVLMRKKIEFFNPKFNKINFYENPADKDDETKWYSYMQQTIKIGEKNNHFYTKEELLQADENPTIIHYYWDKALNKVIVKYEEEKKEYARLNGLDE
jgi:lipopolysaccharide biosynthesis glycosyltransferase